MKKIQSYEQFLNEANTSRYEPHYIIRDMPNIKKGLKKLGFDVYEPKDKNFKYKEDFAYLLTTNAAGDLYTKDVKNLESVNGSWVKWGPGWESSDRQNDSGNNADFFLVIAYDNKESLTRDMVQGMKKLTDRDSYIDFNKDLNK